MMKPPYGMPVPLGITQATVPVKTGLGVDGLEMLQVVSVGKKPTP
jgi:hypothetical protein